MARSTPTFFIVFSLFVIISPVFSQSGLWVEQTLPGNTPMLYDIDMHSANFGFAVGRSNIQPGITYSGVMFTTNGGIAWLMIESHYPIFDPELPDYTVWRGISVLDDKHAIIVGDSAMVYRTTDGGWSWKQDSVVLNPDWASRPTFRDVVMVNTQEAYLVGGDVENAHHPGAEVHPAVVYMTDNGGAHWSDISPTPFDIDYFDRALLTVAFTQGKVLAAGEAGLFLRLDDTAGDTWKQVNMVPPTLQFNMKFTDLDALNSNEYFIVGTNMVTNSPIAYRSMRDGTRFANILPSNIPAGVHGIWAVDFIDSYYGWIGARPQYTGLTNNGGASYSIFSTGTLFPNSRMYAMDFVDDLTGWACGGDEAANTSWILRFHGAPPRPDISTSDTEIDFGTIECERSVEMNIILRNGGTGPLNIDAGGITFNDPGLELLSPTTFPIRLQPRNHITLRVRWTPTRNFFGNGEASLIIHSNDPDHNPWYIRLLLRRNYGSINHPPETMLSYGTCLNDTLQYPTSIPTSGNRTPTFIGWEFVSGHDDFILTTPTPGTVAGTSIPFTYRFAPSDTALRRGVYRLIGGNTACPDTQLVALSGIGQRTIVRPSVNVVDFGAICVGLQRDTSILFTNYGNTYAMAGSLDHVSGDAVFGSHIYGTFIPQDSTRSRELFFRALMPGDFEGHYRIVSGVCPDTMYFTFRGRGLESTIEFKPQGPIRMGPIFVDRITAQSIEIENTGPTPARLTDIRLTNTHPSLQFISRPNLPLTLLPGQITSVTLRFAPYSLGEITTRLLVSWDYQCPDTADLEITAICIPNPEISAPMSGDLGVQPCPEAIRDTVWIRNLGNGPLVFYSVGMTGPDHDHFTVIQPQINDTAKAKSDYPVIIEFNRPVAGRSYGILRLTHNDVDAGRTDIDIFAERTVAEFAIEGDSTTSFFTRLFVPETREFTIRNTSDQNMSITDIVVVQEETVYSTTPSRSLPVELAPGQTMTFEVTFIPDARGPFRGRVQVSGEPCAFSATLGLIGTGDTDGLSADRATINYILDPCRFERACESIVLRNQSPEAVEVLALDIIQSSGVFSIDPPIQTPFQIGPNAERTVYICASPSLIGQDQATMQILSNDPAYPQLNIALRAQRDSSAVFVSHDEIDFGRLAPCDVITPVRVTMTNTGTLSETVVATLLDASAYSVSLSGPQTLLPGGTMTFDVMLQRVGYGVFDDVLELRTARCDAVHRIQLHGELVAQEYAASPDPLLFPTVNVGGTATRQFTVRNDGGFDALISSVVILPNPEFVLQGTAPTDIPANGTRTITIRFNPGSEGVMSGTACVIVSSPCPDTICVALRGEAVRGMVELRPSLLDFGTLAQCEENTLENTLVNVGTGPITLFSDAIIGPSSAAFTNLTPITAPEQIDPGDTRIFRIRHVAANVAGDGPVIATLQIQTSDVALPLMDLPLEAERITQVVDPGQSIAFGVVEAGQPESRIVTLRNRGSTRLCYESAVSPVQVGFSPSLPICLDPGGQIDLTLTLVADASGSFAENLTLIAPTPCLDSTVYYLSATVQEGTLTQSDSVWLPPVSWCDGGRLSLELRSSFLEAVSVDAMHFEGSDASYFSVISPDPGTLPLTLPGGSTLPIHLDFTPDQQSRTFTAVFVTTSTAFGVQMQRRTVVTAEAVVPSLAIDGGTFPPTVVGTSGGNVVLSIRNTSSLPVEVSGVSLSNPAFVIRGQSATPPVLLQPGGEMTVTVEFLPMQTGVINDSLIVLSMNPCEFSANALLTGEGIPQPIVDATLSIGDIQGRVDDVVHIPILVDKTLGGASVAGWTAEVHFNASMLYPMQLVTDGTLCDGMDGTFIWDHETGTVSMRVNGGIIRDGVGPLGLLQCRVLVGDAIATPLQLQHFAFGTGYARVLGTTDGSFELLDYCLPDERLMHDRPGFIVYQSIPNPVSLHRHGEAIIHIALNEECSVQMLLFDAVGRRIDRRELGMLSVGMHSLVQPISMLRPGVYHYVILAGGSSASKTMVIIE